MISSYSHVPVLTLLPLLQGINRVLELGTGVSRPQGLSVCGSSLLFMDPAIYPDLLTFDSLENSEDSYFQAIKGSFPSSNPDRILFYAPLTPMIAMVKRFDLERYDLVFVDDSVSVPARVDTIAYVTETAKRPIVVIHDFDEGSYRAAVRGQWRSCTFQHAVPHTAVLWHEEWNLDRLFDCRDLIAQKFSDQIDASTWRRLLYDHLR